MDNHHHRSGPLKQANKKHKAGRHLTKTALLKSSGGKVDNSIKKGHRLNSLNGKLERQHRSKQIRDLKKQEILSKKRKGSLLGPPKIVGLIALNASCDLPSIVKILIESASSSSTTIQNNSQVEIVTACFAQYKQRFSFISCNRNLETILDVAKVADILVFVLPVKDGTEGVIDSLGDHYISAIRSQGMPASVGVIQGLVSLPLKSQVTMRKYSQRFFQTEFGEDIKIAEEENKIQLVRVLTTVQSKPIHWRDMRSYMLIHNTEFDRNTTEENSPNGTLQVTGYISGQPLSVNQLVHLTDIGTFQIEKITSKQDPSTLYSKQSKKEGIEDMVLDEEENILAIPSIELQEDLQMIAEIDPMASEQTWPTEEEMEEAQLNRKKHHLKGISDYQATWFPINQDGEIILNDNKENLEEEEEEIIVTDSESDDDEEMPFVDPLIVNQVLKKKRDMESDQVDFPDEMDIPGNTSGRLRLARYRGLKSFRTSPFDPKESLPQDYGMLFQFKDYAATQKAILKDIKLLYDEQKKTCSSSSSSTSLNTNSNGLGALNGSVNGLEGVVMSGTFVTLYLKNVPRNALSLKSNQSSPLILSALLKHENRLSVLTFNIQKNSFYEEPIKSKDKMIIHCGFRRYSAKPIYSDNNLNCEKHKFQRFLHAGGWFAATLYGPASFQPAPILMFKPEGDFVASGSLISVNPDRIILKRVVLTGVPVKVKKRRAVVRYMFHDPKDILWFRPVELTTKCGITGHIKESLGTHGDFKAIFSKPIKQSDTVCMNLYKRVYPKFVSHPFTDIK